MPSQTQARAIIRRAEVRQRTGLSDTTIWRLEKAGQFPHRIVLSEGGAIGWHLDEVDQWVHDRVRGAGKRPGGVAPAKQPGKALPPASDSAG